MENTKKNIFVITSNSLSLSVSQPAFLIKAAGLPELDSIRGGKRRRMKVHMTMGFRSRRGGGDNERMINHTETITTNIYSYCKTI